VLSADAPQAAAVLARKSEVVKAAVSRSREVEYRQRLIDTFSKIMMRKSFSRIDKGPLANVGLEESLAGLDAEVLELREALAEPGLEGLEGVVFEAADVALYAMMVARSVLGTHGLVAVASGDEPKPRSSDTGDS
jgi:hypothetical protein